MSRALLDSENTAKSDRAMLVSQGQQGRPAMLASARAVDKLFLDVRDVALTSHSFMRQQAHIRHRRTAAVPGAYVHVRSKVRSAVPVVERERGSVAQHTVASFGRSFEL